MTASTVPDVLAALVAKIRVAAPGLQVINGPPLQNLQPDYVAVGWAGPGHPAVVNNQTRDDYAMTDQSEVYDIAGQIVSWRGAAEEYPDCVATVYATAALIDAAIGADATLGVTPTHGTVVAYWSGADLEPVQTDKGPVAALTFTVHVEAYF